MHTFLILFTFVFVMYEFYTLIHTETIEYFSKKLKDYTEKIKSQPNEKIKPDNDLGLYSLFHVFYMVWTISSLLFLDGYRIWIILLLLISYAKTKLNLSMKIDAFISILILLGLLGNYFFDYIRPYIGL